MRQIIITLLISIVVFIGTLVVTNMYVSRKSIETADYINAKALDNFQQELNGDILMTEQSARCFLSGISSLSTEKGGDCFVFDDEYVAKFKNRIHHDLLAFMEVNPYYLSSMFIVDAQINRKYFGGEGYYAPTVFHNDSTLYDVAAGYDFSISSHFQYVKKEKKKLWAVPSPTSPQAGKLMTLYIPLELSNGQFFGTFAVSLDVKMINTKLKKYLPYGMELSGMFLVDADNNIFAACPSWIIDNKKQFKDKDVLKESDYKGVDHKMYIYEGKEYYAYQRDSLYAPWRIYTICVSDAIYGEAKSVVTIVFVTSFVGMFLMMICCIVISCQIRKNMRRKATMEEDLKLATRMQMSMLKPSEFSTLKTFIRPAREIGGDLYDYVEKDGKLIFCIGDVSGKGMPAALFMTQVVSLFRNAVLGTCEPAGIASQINDVLVQNNKDMTFCTFFVGVLSGTKLSFCNAGHNPPVFIPVSPSSNSPFSISEGQGGASFMKVRPNLALGLMEGFPYKAEEIEFNVGDTFLLYTDGVTEAKNKKHKEFGEQCLLEVLSSNSSPFIPHILNAIASFVGKNEQSDDITMIEIHKL